MPPEDVRQPDGGRGGSRRSFLQPPHDVADTDENDDQLETPIPWQRPLENQIERLRSDAGAGDAPDMHSPGAEPLKVRWALEQALQRAGPARILIEQIALGLASA